MNRVIQIVTVLVAAFVAVPAQANGYGAMIGHMVGPMMHMMQHGNGYGPRRQMGYEPGPQRMMYGQRMFGRRFIQRPGFVERPRFIERGGIGGAPVYGGGGGEEYGGGGGRIETFHFHTEHYRHVEGGGPIIEEQVAPARIVRRHCCERARPRVYYARPAPRPDCSCGCCGGREEARVVRYHQEPAYDQPGDSPAISAPTTARELTQSDVELLRSVYK